MRVRVFPRAEPEFFRKTSPGEHTLTDPFGRQYRSGAPSLTDPVAPEPATATAGAHLDDSG